VHYLGTIRSKVLLSKLRESKADHMIDSGRPWPALPAERGGSTSGLAWAPPAASTPGGQGGRWTTRQAGLSPDVKDSPHLRPPPLFACDRQEGCCVHTASACHAQCWKCMTPLAPSTTCMHRQLRDHCQYYVPFSKLHWCDPCDQ